ncbi:hypothetical protein HPT27_09300 [Permianibacter sp. IMCC34836]|uniref:hypothetical protein n=1 Tax=Permianibacter fluminis TaxID=2738515 RepID=UPI001554B041|nr:hypothetical protein [Permianibacter fluminis]NQD37222.1 hypothetical protein [Permianibacter fluminis]
MTAPITAPVESTETTQAVVEQPVPADRVVNDYGSTWLLYILVACVFLVVLYRTIRRWPKWLMVPVWSLFAAGALTPAASTGDGPWLAPAAIVGILGFDQDGMTGLMRGAVPIVISFLIVTAVLGALLFVLSRRQKPAAASTISESDVVTASADASVSDAERQEPKL